MKIPFVSTRVSGRADRRICAGLLLGLLGLGAASIGLAQTDNFNDSNDVGWTHYDPLGGLGAPAASFTFPGGNSYRIADPARPSGFQGAGQARAGALYSASNYTDFYIEVDLLNWNNSIDQAVGILARITSPGLGISWPGEATGFTLEYSTTLPATTWQQAPSDQIIGPFEQPFPNDPDFKYFDFDTTGNKYFRLRQQ